MSKSVGKGVYLVLVTVLAVVVCLGVMQVPQPWRGPLVLGLFAAGLLGLPLALIAGERRESGPSAAPRLTGEHPTPPAPTLHSWPSASRKPSSRRRGLRVVSEAGTGSRYVVR